jgi:hypothetical protein
MVYGDDNEGRMDYYYGREGGLVYAANLRHPSRGEQALQ